jgi:glucose/arabinose dehydrogenase
MLLKHALLKQSYLFLLFLLASLLGACGGGGGDGSPASATGPVLQQPGAAAPTVGTLALTIGELPPGTAAAVRVTGPNSFSLGLSQSQSLTGLQPGTYAIAAAPVVVGEQTWVPASAIQEVQVSAGNTASAGVAYALNTVALTLTRFAGGLSAPVFLTAPAGDARQFIVERAGRILLMQDGMLQAQPFLDIRALIDPSVDGLMSVAFDPGYAGNGHFYVCRTDLEHDIVIERYTVSSNPSLADPASSLTILRIPHPDSNLHFGGQVSFGPDGYLYAATGDGGVLDDAQGNARNPASLLGKLLRLDVSAAGAAEPYRIPPSNPYLGQPGKRPEIWASGLRNPWRFSFDRGATAGASLYIADIGQDTVEEIDLVPASQGGLNYGWNRMEGSTCYLAQACDRDGVTLPVLEYVHTTAADSPCSITGGYVYRGTAIPELAGRYFYSDFCAGFLRSFYADGSAVYEQRDWNLARLGQVTSFGEDGKGELYLITLTGEIWKIERATQ